MTEIQKIIDLLLPELLQQLDNKNSSDLSQKGLDKGNGRTIAQQRKIGVDIVQIPSIHCGKKGV